MKKETILSVVEIEEIIRGEISAATRVNMIRYFVAELERRKKVAKVERSGRHRVYSGDAKERNRLAAEKYRNKAKTAESG